MGNKIITIVLINGNEIKTLISKIISKTDHQILANIVMPHDGFFEGKFLNKENFMIALQACISKAESSAKIICKDAIVAIPPEFCEFEFVSSKIEFNKIKKITEKDIDNLTATAVIKLKTEKRTLIGGNPCQYYLDENEVLENVIDKKSRSLMADFSFSFADNDFLTFLNQCLKKICLQSATFVPLTLCEFTNLFSLEDKKNGVIFVDFDNLATSIIICKGNAIVKQISIPFGYAHIISSVQESFDLSYANCVEIVDNCILSVFPKNEERLIFDTKLYSKSKIYDLCRTCCGAVSKQIAKTLKEADADPSKILYITGNGICELKGIKQILANETKRKIEYLVSQNPQFDRMPHAGLISLYEYALNLKKLN